MIKNRMLTVKSIYVLVAFTFILFIFTAHNDVKENQILIAANNQKILQMNFEIETLNNKIDTATNNYIELYQVAYEEIDSLRISVLDIKLSMQYIDSVDAMSHIDEIYKELEYLRRKVKGE